MKNLWILLFALVLTPSGTDAFAAPVEDFSEKAASLYAQDFDCARKLQQALRADDRKAVAALIDYPVHRGRPLPPIRSEQGLVENWDDFFDETTIAPIIDATPQVMGWRGVMLGQSGQVWFNNGKINGINMRTSSFEKKFAQARAEEEKSLHPSARGYETIERQCTTPTLQVRIQNHGNDLHYFAWKKESSLLEKPLVALKGSVDIQGSAGNRFYTFIDRTHVYVVDDPVLCADDCARRLVTIRNGKKVSSVLCE